MSSSFFVYTPNTGDRDDKDSRPHVFDHSELAEALRVFLAAVVNEEWAELHWSS